MSSLGDLSQEVRRFIPLPILLGIGRRRVDALWKNEAYRAHQEENMRFLLEFTDRAHEVPTLAREYAEFDVLRNYRRWRPRPLLRQRVQGIEWLTTKRDPARGIVLSFMHHGQYDGLMGSIARAGVNVYGVAAPEAFDPKAPIQIRQHFKVCSVVPEAPIVNAAEGAAPLAALLEKGEVLALASDVAGRTPINFLGRDMLGSFGAARIATQTNAQVVHLTSHLGADGKPYFQLHEPLEPSDFADPAELLAAIFKKHEPAVLAWPAAYDSPHGRLAVPSQTT